MTPIAHIYLTDDGKYQIASTLPGLETCEMLIALAAGTLAAVKEAAPIVSREVIVGGVTPSPQTAVIDEHVAEPSAS